MRISKAIVSIFLLIICIIAKAQTSPDWYSITAFLPNWNKATVSVVVDDVRIHTGTVQKDIFNYTAKFNGLKQGFVEVRYGKSVAFLPIFIEHGTIRIRDAGNKNLVAFGTQCNDLLFALNKKFDSLAAAQNSTNFSKSMQFKRELATAFIHDNPASFVSLQLLKDYYYLQPESSDTLYYALFNLLDGKLKNTVWGKKMALESNTRYTTAIGKTAPAVNIYDSLGKPVQVYEKGMYTLVDFWASWCAPCRKENPALLSLYNKYKASNFRIIGVSLDTDRSRWLTAIKKDNLTWYHVSDLKGWNSTVIYQYGIKVIPMNYLLNGEGVIVAKNLYAAQLDEVLNKLLQKSSIEAL